MRRVDDVFNIHKEGRTGGNGRRYVLHAVRQMIQSPATQEGLKLGELEGYYGHGRRQLTGKMRLPEVEVITVGGQQVVIENVPSNRTVALDVDDSGNVSHTQEVLDTAPGLIVQVDVRFGEVLGNCLSFGGGLGERRVGGGVGQGNQVRDGSGCGRG